MWAHPLVRLALAPVMVMQGLAVRKHALILPEAAGPRHGVAGDGSELRVLITGDSSAAGVGVAHQDQALAGQLVAALAPQFTVHWQLEARTGATTAQSLEHLRGLDAGPFDIVVQALGVNDVTHQVRLSRWLADQSALASLYQNKFGARFVYRSGVPPLGLFPVLPAPLRHVLGAQARQFDAALAANSTGNLRHLPFDPDRLDPAQMAEDGFHPGAPVYTLWAQELAQMIRRDLRG